MNDYADYYKGRLEKALIYQDFVIDRLRKYDVGIIILACTSRKYQFDFGESFTGLEIKHDMQINTYNNIFIETAEKSSPDQPTYVSSGIFRKDKCWLYLVGDYNQAFLFSKKQLQKIYESTDYREKHGMKDKEISTAKGFIFPVEEALKSPYLLYHFSFKECE